MVKNILILPDGTEIFSGNATGPAVMNCVFTESVNNDQELTLGSAVASALEVSVFSPGGSFSIEQGTEFTYWAEEDGVRRKIGMFTAQGPKRVSANILRITAYDRMTWFDADMKAWLATLDNKELNLGEFVQQLCTQVGVPLKTADFPNARMAISKITKSYTGRQLLEYAGQLAGRFVRIDRDGQVEFAWYSYPDNPNTQLGPSAQDSATLLLADNSILYTGRAEVYTLPVDRLGYYAGSLSYENYETEAINRICVQENDEDQGIVYPPEPGNTYVIVGNPFLKGKTREQIIAAEEVLLRGVGLAYTPLQVTTQATLKIRAGDIVRVQDYNGKVLYTVAMNSRRSNQKMTISSTGAKNRASSDVTNSTSLKAVEGKFKYAMDDLVSRGDLASPGKVKVCADNITAGSLSAERIQQGVLKSRDGAAFYLDLDKNELSADFRKLRVRGETVDQLLANALADAKSSGMFTGPRGEKGDKGEAGADGLDGRGISAVCQQFYLSDSGAVLSGGSWVEEMPAITGGKYLWLRNQVAYTDGTVHQTKEYCISVVAEQSVKVASNGNVLEQIAASMGAKFFMAKE